MKSELKCCNMIRETGGVAVSKSRLKGICLVVFSAALWGISAPVVQFLFKDHHVSPEWLVVVRLLISGFILLGLALLSEKEKVWAIWKDRKDAVSLVLFSLLGMLATQYTFFLSIHYGNAATTTVLQYTAPVMITCYLAFTLRRIPKGKEIIAVILAVFGTFMLTTRGSFTSLSISGLAVFWGLCSAVALAFYTLQPIKLLSKWGSPVVVGWGMFIAGFAFSFIHPPWNIEHTWNLANFSGLFFIIIFGTLIPFYYYLDSLHYLKASETSLIATLEPLTAVLVSIFWLGLEFGFAEWIGTLCIISTLAILSLSKEEELKSKNGQESAESTAISN